MTVETNRLTRRTMPGNPGHRPYFPQPGDAHAAGAETLCRSPQERQISSEFFTHNGGTNMETELLGITLAAVLPLYPLLIAIYQRMGRYDEVVEEFRRLRDEHEHAKEVYHGC